MWLPRIVRPSCVYAHLLADDHSDAMAALGVIGGKTDYGPNVIRMRG